VIKKYNLFENFIRVYPQFIDVRLTEQWVSPIMDMPSIANTITHLLIYQDAINIGNLEKIEITDRLVDFNIEDDKIYSFNHINLSYVIAIDNVKKILNQKPLSMPIEHMLVDLGYEIKNMGNFTINNDVWTEVFAK